jgi:hypothetical protein
VQVGVRNVDRAQIVSGINPNDPVITSGGYALPDNTQIKVEASEPADKEESSKASKPEKDDKAGDSKKPDDKDKE